MRGWRLQVEIRLGHLTQRLLRYRGGAEGYLRDHGPRAGHRGQHAVLHARFSYELDAPHGAMDILPLDRERLFAVGQLDRLEAPGVARELHGVGRVTVRPRGALEIVLV